MTTASPQTIRLVYVVTVPQALIFLRGHLAHLKARGFDLHVISSPGADLDAFAAREGVTAHGLPIARPIRLGQDFIALFRLVRLLRRLRPDIVHAYTPKAGLLGTLAARVAGAPVVALSVFGLPQMTRGGLLRLLLDATTRLSCRLADWVWCDSFSLGDYLAKHRLCKPEKVVTLGAGSVNGLDAERVFNPSRFSLADRLELRKQCKIPANGAVIGFVGRIARDKGVRELASAWKALRERHSGLHLLLVGPKDAADPPDAADWTALQNDSRVHWIGMQADVARYLSLIDVFINPSYREGFGAANLEASAMGVPVVSTRIPGCVDSVSDGVTGLLVPPRDAAALTEAVSIYLDDLDLRRAHGDAGRARVLAHFRPESYWALLEQAYRGLLDRNRKTAPRPLQPITTT